MALRPADFKSAAYTDFATQAYDKLTRTKKPGNAGLLLKLEAEVGIEPAYADLQSAA